VNAAPWAAETWMNCAGSVALSAKYPDLTPDAPKRVEGRAWHKAAELMVQTGELPDDPDVAEGAIMWADTLAALAPGATWAAEERLPCSLIHPSIPDGRADAITRHDGWVRTADYKAGHSYVDEFENWQQVIYLIAYFRKHALAHSAFRCSVTIVQPRYFGPAGKVRTWEFPATRLPEFEERIKTAAWRTLDANPLTKVGPWCAKCDGARGCAQLAQATGAIGEWIGEAKAFDPSPSDVAGELRMLINAEKLLKDRRAAMEEQALHFINNGRGVPGFERGQVASRETFPAESHAELLQVAEFLGVDAARPPEPITPAQLRKKGVDESVIKKYAVTPPGAIRLQMVNPKHTRRMFEQ
jgi:hypothetical protein